MIYGWFYAIAIHGVLLLGAALVEFGWRPVGEAGIHSDYTIAVRPIAPSISRIEAIPEPRKTGLSKTSDPVIIEREFVEPADRVGTYSAQPGANWIIVDPPHCSVCVGREFPEYEGRVIVLRSRPVLREIITGAWSSFQRSRAAKVWTCWKGP